MYLKLIGKLCIAALAAVWTVTGTPAVSAPLAFCVAGNGTAEDPTYPIRKLAFDELAAGHSDQARELLRDAVDANSKDRIALAQLVYLDIRAGLKGTAIRDIEQLRGLNCRSKELEMQLGYLYEEKKHLVPARMAFERAIEYNDPATTEQARKALSVIDAEWPRFRQLSFVLDSQYMTRFDDGIADLDVRFSQRLSSGSPLSLYTHTRILRDTASHLGQLPQIYSDNATLFGGGLFFQPYGSHYFLSAEANEAYLFKENSRGRSNLVPDFRIVGGYFRSWPESGKRFHFETNGSIGYYSRYKQNGIAYLQPREVLNAFHLGKTTVAGYLQQNVALDTNREFYNNTAEIVPGLDLRTAWMPGMAIRAEYVRGYYLDLPSHNINPYGSQYRDVRVRLLLGEKFSVGSR